MVALTFAVNDNVQLYSNLPSFKDIGNKHGVPREYETNYFPVSINKLIKTHVENVNKVYAGFGY